MVNYPTSLDTDGTLYNVTDNIDFVLAVHHNALKDAVIAIETALGITGAFNFITDAEMTTHEADTSTHGVSQVADDVDLHDEAHVLATSGPHTGELPLTDLAAGTAGDVIIRGAADWQVLNKGDDTQVLTLTSGYPAWQDSAGGGAHTLDGADHTDIPAMTEAEGDIIYRNASSQWVNLAKGADNYTLMMNGNIPAWEDHTGASAHHTKYALLDDLIANEIAVIKAIDDASINNTKWDYLADMTEDPQTHFDNTSNPHSVTEGGAGTDTTAIHDNVVNEIGVITLKTALVSGDDFLIEDSEASNAKKHTTFGYIESSLSLANLGSRNHSDLNDDETTQHVDWAAGSAGTIHTDNYIEYTDAAVESVITAELVDGQSIDNAIDGLISTHNVANNHLDWTDSVGTIHTGNYIEGGAGTDTTAIHDNVNNEINSITSKTSLDAGNVFVLEDNTASYAKKRVTFLNLIGSISLANLGTRDHGSLSDAPEGAHHAKTHDNTEHSTNYEVANANIQSHVGSPPADSHHAKYALTEDLAAGEITQLQNIGDKTITYTQWGYLGDTSENIQTHMSATNPHSASASDTDLSNHMSDTSTHGVAQVANHGEIATQISTHTSDDNAHHEVFENLVEDATPQLYADSELDLNQGRISLNATGPGADSATGIIMNRVAGETLAFPDLVCIKSDGRVWKTDATSSATMPCIGMALESKVVTETVKVLLLGYVYDPTWDWTLGDGEANLLYADDTTAGGMTIDTSSFADTGDQVQVVGSILSADYIYFNPSLVLVEIT